MIEREREHQHQLSMDYAEVTRIWALLCIQDWVQSIRYPGVEPHEMVVDTTDDKIWRIAHPLHFIRLMQLYRPS